MQVDSTKMQHSDTYIWEQGYLRPSEEERICTFACSCIESVAERMGCKPSEMFRRMEKVGLIHNYIIPCYDTLHTESRDNVTNDIIETLIYWEEKKGIKE